MRADLEFGSHAVDREETIEQFVEAVLFDFSNTLDFIWKIPSFIEQQLEIEAGKLADYFPKPSPARDIRWAFESKKIGAVFPYLIASGSLFATLSLFEIYLIRLEAILQKPPKRLLVEKGSGGMRRALDRLRGICLNLEDLPMWPQVDAARKIRNCLIHASGFLGHSTQDEELRTLVSSKGYLILQHRGKRIGKDVSVRLVTTPFGDRIEITHKYSWIATSYCRDFLFALVEATAGLPPRFRELKSFFQGR